MMQPFLGPNFLLETEAAQKLYHEHAADMPIVDYHNHLCPQVIAENHQFDDIGSTWLAGDHYKWRAMRWAGVDESLITGTKTSFKDKFHAFAEVMPKFLGNPLYHWTHLEMYRYFGLEGVTLSAKTADTVWDVCNAKLAKKQFSARGLLSMQNVKMLGTTDDPCDDLRWHKMIAQDATCDMVVRPTFRPDPAFKINKPTFPAYMQKLSKAAGFAINSYEKLLEALALRLNHFDAHGCNAADHGLDSMLFCAVPSSAELNRIFNSGRDGAELSIDDVTAFQSAVQVFLGQEYAKRNWVMQLHIGATRNNRTRLFKALGPDVGVDGIDDRELAIPLNQFLDTLDRDKKLPRTVLYSLDPTKNEVVVTTAGNFQDGTIAGKVQAGTGWWHNDQLDGMERQMTQLAQMGLLSQFLGMLTDSRSFLSFPRHEYFRRLLCKMVGEWMANGHIPADYDLTGSMIKDICYRNAAKWFLDEK
ncbi:glucuronate isomerase [Pseudovibrio sp. Tun.PSC04-5.I4]|uniref:glucuronate isomerase n=1 Tax=Pseudovibrio sp. Tun.PSC04-5.I4 TaxID=1798213 RepID=UPI0008857F14|nr:glucuronate isomerase [Pseudovibrio sp. Tun.PSC04-5.I4]SDQ72305.1 D-glucuronate isomerase [Pseudovibrio sp. Tun.PSC04-5.I4]